MDTKKGNLTTYLAAASLLLVFVIDVVTPAHLAIDILYLCCILILFKQKTSIIVSFSTVACLLILINAFFENQGLGITAWVNRLISISAIFITSYIAVHYRMASKRGFIKDQQYLRSLEDMLFITSHQVRKPVANILGLTDLINADNEQVNTNDLKEHCRLLQHSATELDDFIKELSKAIREAEEHHRRPGYEVGGLRQETEKLKA